MKYSDSFIKTSKEAPKEANTISHKLLMRGTFIHPLGAGFYSLLPLGFKVYRKIYDIITEELNNIGTEDMMMPVVHPARVWKETGRFDEVGPELWKIKNRSDEDFVLAMTHEEVVTDAAKGIISSYKDLPKLVGQIQTKVRDEVRARGGLLRTKEFTMQDAYSFDKDEAGLDEVYNKFIEAYKNIFSRVGVETVMIESDTGAMGGSCAHEFMMIATSGEDKIVTCQDCGHAVNAEVLGIAKEGAEDPVVECKKCQSNNCEFKRGIEVGNIFKLGTKYSKPLKLMFTDEDNTQKPVIMGSYGIGLERLLASVVEASHDENGIIWPKAIAPYTAYLISISQDDMAEKVYEDLKKQGVEVLYDNRDVSPGEKFADADLLGIPYRLTVSDKTEGKIEVKQRDSSETTLVDSEDLAKSLQ
ncbi:MAG: aminoacyl--tRNA ligase-related protein [Patescibacteria group bacterium]|nr:aminoacyl--tRNA ligase-related protein [Patescibacteria group bacterium]